MGAFGGGSVATVFVDVEGDLTKFKKDVAGAGDAASKTLGGKMQKAGKVAGTALAVGAAGALAGGVSAFVDFERGMNEVFTLIPDAGQGAFDDLTGQTKDFAKEFGVLPADVIPALYDSLSAGVPSDNVFAFLEDANKFAKAGAVDLGTAVDGLTSTVNAYGLGADGAGRVSDALFTSVKLGKTTVQELSDSMFQVAPIAASFGVSVEDVAAGFATLTAQGTPTSVAATQMKGAISELGKSGTKASKAFEDITGKTFPEFIDGGGTLVEAADLMSTGAEDLGLSVVDLFGSIDAGQAFVGLSADVEGATATLDAVKDSAGSTDVAFAQMEKGIGPTMDKLKARFSVVAIELGTALAPSIEKVAGVALTFAEILGTLPGPVLAAIVGFAGLAGGLLALSGPILRTTKLVSGLFKLISANPYILLAAATIAIAIIIYKNWDEIVAFLKAAWEKIKGALEDAWNWIKSTTETVWNAISGFFDRWWPLLLGIFTGGMGNIVLWVVQNWDSIKAKTVEIWDSIKGFLSQWWPLLLGVMTGGIGLVIGLIIQNWDSIKAKTVEIWESIAGFIGDKIDAVKGFVDGLVGKLDYLKSIVEGIPGFMLSAWNTAVGYVNTAVDQALAALERLRAGIDRALGPLDEIIGKAAKIGGGIIGGVGGFLGFDDGGVVPGPIGAPRLILAHAGETILPTHKDPGAGGSGGVSVSIGQVSISNDMDIETVARELGRRIDRERRAQGRAS